MQKVDHDRDIAYLKGNPGMNYSPRFAGKELMQDASAYSIAGKHHFQDSKSVIIILLNLKLCVDLEEKRRLGIPGPDQYLPRANLDHFGNRNNFKNKFKNPPGACFGQSNRFAIPLGKEKQRGATPGKYSKTETWCMNEAASNRKNLGRPIIGKEKVDILI